MYSIKIVLKDKARNLTQENVIFFSNKITHSCDAHKAPAKISKLHK